MGYNINYMEFLDPEEKKAKTKQLFIAYFLAVIAVVSTTIVLSFVLQGFDLLSRQAESKNGLLFVNSQPVSANIFIDDKPSKRTESRFVLPEGSYNLKLSEPGYRDWQKQVQVVGGQVRYEVYPWLFPTNIITTNISSFAEAPAIYTQSIDKKWLIIAPNRQQAVLNKYDLNDLTLPPTILTLQPNIITPEEIASAQLTEIEWASSNKQVLFKKTLASGITKYLLIDIERPEQSLDLSALFGLNDKTIVSMRDKKSDKFYILDKTTGILKSATISGGIEPKVYADNVIDYKSYGNDIIMYTTNSGAKEGFLSVRVVKNNEAFLLESIKLSQTVFLDISTYENEFYYAIGSEANDSIDIYLNPLNQTPNIVDNGTIQPQLKLLINNLQKLTFSPNSRFIAGQSAQDFVVYDAELTKTYQFKAPLTLASNNLYDWMDGHRFMNNNNDGLLNIYEFDGQNNQIITPNLSQFKVYFDKDYKYMLNIVKSPDNKFTLQQSSLRAP